VSRDAQLTISDLERWVDHGAQWRALEYDEQHVLVELCTCYGEPVDVVRGTAPELIAYVRARGRSGE
jgi:hypothetical protein